MLRKWPIRSGGEAVQLRSVACGRRAVQSAQPLGDAESPIGLRVSVSIAALHDSAFNWNPAGNGRPFITCP